MTKKQPTFDEWKRGYRKYRLSFWTMAKLSRSIEQVGFFLHFRCPDRNGYFLHNHGRWCWPWQWYRLYYETLYPTK